MYELSILAGVDSFAYIVRDRSRNQLLAYHATALNGTARPGLGAFIQRQVAADPVLSGIDYGSVLLGWETERLALVPKGLFEPERRRNYLEQLTKLTQGEEVCEEFYNDLDAHLLYVVDGQTLQLTTESLHSARIQHAAGGLLNAWATRSRRLGHASVSAAFRAGSVLVAAHRAGTLLYYNTFSYRTPEDALYYILLAYDQAALLPNRASLYLAGEVLSSGDVYRLLYTYVQDIHFCRYGAPPALPPELRDLPGHLYFDLLCLG